LKTQPANSQIKPGVIIEGMKGIGKTTFINILLKELNYDEVRWISGNELIRRTEQSVSYKFLD